MIRGYAHKQPNEIFPINMDFANDLSTGESLSAPTVTSRNEQTGADTSATLLQGAALISGTKVAQTIKAGATGERHIVTFRVTTSASNTFEAEVKVTVEED